LHAFPACFLCCAAVMDVADLLFLDFDVSRQIFVSKVVPDLLVMSDTYLEYTCHGNDLNKYRPSLVHVSTRVIPKKLFFS
jgi:hypothetical protein